MATKAEIMAALLAQKEKQSGNNNSRQSGGDNASYPFWNIDVGATATVRFLPDGDKDNTFFWVKREVIKMPFEGVEGGDYPTNKQVTVTVPCVEMWGDTCPILAATRPMWKDPAKEATARLYWKKKSFIFQGFVVSSPFEEQNLPENPIRRFVINPSIFEIIEKSLMDPEMEDMPTDYVAGVDFRIRKTKKGEYSNYSTSEWSRKTRSLSEAEMVAIEQHDLFDLKQYLGRRPDGDELAAIKAMFDDSLAGRPFDYASYGQYYRPFGGGNRDDADASTGQVARAASTASTVKAAAPAASAPAVEEEDEPAAPKASGGNPSAHEILERIKNRTMNK